MIAVPGRHRSLALLAGVLVSQVLLLAVQIRRDTQHVRLIRAWTVGTVTPFERAGTWSITKVRDTWNGYLALVHTHRDDLAMKAEMDRLKIQNAELQSQSAEAQRYGAMLGFISAHTEVPMVAARVVAASADSASHSFYIDRGEREGIKRDMAVITADGVVGKVLYVYGHVSNVLEITDRDSGVGALMADSRIQGPIGGTGDPLMVMKYVSNDDDVKVGQQILTSGQDQIFPKDLPVGTITEVKPGNPFKLIRVKPAARLDQLEEVMVLLTRQDLNMKPAAAPAMTTPDVPAPAPAARPSTPPAKR